MIALYIPMQPSSKIPITARSCWRARASRTPRDRASESSPGQRYPSSGRAWLVSCPMRPVSIHCRSARRDWSSSKVSLQIVL